jgi:hypothetical protein
MDENNRTANPGPGAGGWGSSFPRKGVVMRVRVDRKRGEVKQDALAGVENAKLAAVKGGLKAERVQGADPTGAGGN